LPLHETGSSTVETGLGGAFAFEERQMNGIIIGDRMMDV